MTCQSSIPSRLSRFPLHSLIALSVGVIFLSLAYQINPIDFGVSQTNLTLSGKVIVQPSTETIYALDLPTHLLRIYP